MHKYCSRREYSLVSFDRAPELIKIELEKSLLIFESESFLNIYRLFSFYSLSICTAFDVDSWAQAICRRDAQSHACQWGT